MADRGQKLARWRPLSVKPRDLSRTHTSTFSLSAAFSHARRGTTERRRAPAPLYRCLAPAPPRHCRLHLVDSFATFPSTSSTWLQRQTSYGEGKIAIPVLTRELGSHGRLHGELAAAWLACALLSILSVRAWLGCRLASGMMLPCLDVSPT